MGSMRFFARRTTTRIKNIGRYCKFRFVPYYHNIYTQMHITEKSALFKIKLLSHKHCLHLRLLMVARIRSPSRNLSNVRNITFCRHFSDIMAAACSFKFTKCAASATVVCVRSARSHKLVRTSHRLRLKVFHFVQRGVGLCSSPRT